jgi:hypothetical protein
MGKCLQRELDRLRVDKGQYARRKVLLGTDGLREITSVADLLVVDLEWQLIGLRPLLGHSFELTRMLILYYLYASRQEDRLSSF